MSVFGLSALAVGFALPSAAFARSWFADDLRQERSARATSPSPGRGRPVQPGFETDLTAGEYVRREEWRNATPPPCLAPRRGRVCGIVRHGTYGRGTPVPMPVARFDCRGCRTTFSRLLDFAAARLPGDRRHDASGPVPGMPGGPAGDARRAGDTETPLEGRAGKGQDGRAGTREAKLPSRPLTGWRRTRGPARRRRCRGALRSQRRPPARPAPGHGTSASGARLRRGAQRRGAHGAREIVIVPDGAPQTGSSAPAT